jgi:hypothetical protein
MSDPGALRAHRSPGLFAIWFPIVGSIAAWAVHLVGEASLVRSAQVHPWVVWVMHGLTVATAAVCVACIAIAWRSTRLGARVLGGERSGAMEGRASFLGWLGVYIASFNLALILAEELIILELNRHA